VCPPLCFFLPLYLPRNWTTQTREATVRPMEHRTTLVGVGRMQPTRQVPCGMSCGGRQTREREHAPKGLYVHHGRLRLCLRQHSSVRYLPTVPHSFIVL
jgi:hypothetical protein